MIEQNVTAGEWKEQNNELSALICLPAFGFCHVLILQDSQTKGGAMLNPKLPAEPSADFGGHPLSAAITAPCMEKLLIQP